MGSTFRVEVGHTYRNRRGQHCFVAPGLNGKLSSRLLVVQIIDEIVHFNWPVMTYHVREDGLAEPHPPAPDNTLREELDLIERVCCRKVD